MTSTGAPPHAGNQVGPSLTRLIARRRDLDLAGRALVDSRLLTFTGPGGVGKTRLALELAYRSRGRFDHGVWLVELADLAIGAGPSDVEASVVNALGISDQSSGSPRDKLRSYLFDRRLLLVIDNCEHVLPSVRAVLPVLLREAPQLRVVATSREPVNIPGELLRPVLPLTVPEPGTSAAQLVADGSVSLLVERVRSVDADFVLTDDNAASVIELCRLLDGIPLAIELAAVRLRALTVEQVVDRFGHRLSALTAEGTSGPRHRSLRAMVDWSHELCPPSARVLWRRLSVFPAGFDLELAETVCAYDELRPENVVDLVDGLVGQSILLTERVGNSMRYRLPAPLREVAADLAVQAGEATYLQLRHRDALAQRAEQMLASWCGPHQETLITRMRLDHAGYVAAIHWSTTTPGEEHAGLQLLAALRYHWLSGGLLAEGRMRIEALLAKTDQQTLARGDCLWVVSWIALLQGDRDTAKELLVELASLADALNEPRLHTQLRHLQALLAMMTGDVTSAVRGFKQAIDEHHTHGDRFEELTARYMLAVALVFDGRAHDAVELSNETVALCEQYGDRTARAYAIWAAGLAHWQLGQLDEAERAATSVLRLQRRLSDAICVALTTHLLACIAHDRRQRDRAATLSEAARRVWRSLGTSLDAFGPQLAELIESRTPTGRTSPAMNLGAGPQPFTELDGVIALSLGAERPPTAATRISATQNLTKRELEVAALVEDGLSNREIAQRLIIAKRTADGHVERILAKLGFTSRAQIAAWMARRQNT